MATPRRVTLTEAQQAVQRITARRHEIDDKHRDLLSDDPADVLVYLRRHSGREVPARVREQDVHDGLIISTYLWWRHAEDELWLLESAEILKVPRRSVGALLRIKTGQGVIDRRDRLRAMLGPLGVPSEKLWREHRGSPTDPRQRWLDAHRRAISEITKVVLNSAELVADDDVAADLDDLSRNEKADTFTPGCFVELLLAGQDLQALPAVRELQPGHPLLDAMTRLEDLKTKWRSLPQ